MDNKDHDDRIIISNDTNDTRVLSNLVLQSGAIGAIDALNITESVDVHIGNVVNIDGSIQINQYIVEEKIIPTQKPKKEKIVEERNTQESYDTDDDDDFINVSPYDNILTGFRIVTKLEWKARAVDPKLEYLDTPVPYVIIAHTATDIFRTKIDNIYHLRYLQDYHMNFKKWSDISYNFLVGGDGSAFEGRGWNVIGTHSKTFNNKSICIAFVGTFCQMTAPQVQIDAAKKLIELCYIAGKIDKNYKLIGHRQTYETVSPGDCLFEEIKTWPHFCDNID